MSDSFKKQFDDEMLRLSRLSQKPKSRKAFAGNSKAHKNKKAYRRKEKYNGDFYEIDKYPGIDDLKD